LGKEFKGKTREEHYALGDLFIDADLPETDLHIFSSKYGFLGLFPIGNRKKESEKISNIFHSNS
jgi:hypothetical protein